MSKPSDTSVAWIPPTWIPVCLRILHRFTRTSSNVKALWGEHRCSFDCSCVLTHKKQKAGASFWLNYKATRCSSEAVVNKGETHTNNPLLWGKKDTHSQINYAWNAARCEKQNNADVLLWRHNLSIAKKKEMPLLNYLTWRSKTGTEGN